MQITSGASSYSFTAGDATAAKAAKSPAASLTSQTDDNGPSSDGSVVEEFLKYAKMNPFDRMRANILKSMNLSEADLQKMSPDQKAAVEQKIKDAIQKELEMKDQQPGSLVDVSA